LVTVTKCLVKEQRHILAQLSGFGLYLHSPLFRGLWEAKVWRDKAANLRAARKQQERRKRVLVKGMLLATCAFHLSLTF
jgi:dolichol kinase